MTLKTLKGIDFNALIERHVERATRATETLANPEDIRMDGHWEPKITVIEGKPPPRKAILLPKYQLLIHLIIERCGNDKDGRSYFPTKDYVPIFGRQFLEMLPTLEEMGIISLGYYQRGINSRPVKLLNWEVGELTTMSKAIAGQPIFPVHAL